jgi:hypothetical protein
MARACYRPAPPRAPATDQRPATAGPRARQPPRSPAMPPSRPTGPRRPTDPPPPASRFRARAPRAAPPAAAADLTAHRRATRQGHARASSDRPGTQRRPGELGSFSRAWPTRSLSVAAAIPRRTAAERVRTAAVDRSGCDIAVTTPPGPNHYPPVLPKRPRRSHSADRSAVSWAFAANKSTFRHVIACLKVLLWRMRSGQAGARVPLASPVLPAHPSCRYQVVAARVFSGSTSRGPQLRPWSRSMRGSGLLRARRRTCRCGRRAQPSSRS